MNKTINVKVAGLGGQGVIRASDILAEAAFRAGLAVKKSELHGMSQRGGSVSSDVRFGKEVWSPMIPAGESDYLVVVSADQVENNLPALKKDGLLIRPEMIDEIAAHEQEEPEHRAAGRAECASGNPGSGLAADDPRSLRAGAL